MKEDEIMEVIKDVAALKTSMASVQNMLTELHKQTRNLTILITCLLTVAVLSCDKFATLLGITAAIADDF